MGDHARLMSFLWFAMELAMSSPLFAKLSALFSSDAACLEGLERVRGRGHERLRVVAYRLGGLRYSWAPRFRLAVLLLLRDKFPELVGAIEVVDPTVAPVERRAMEELGCIVTTSPALCLVVEEPTLIFMPYADRVFFENLLILNWSPDKLGKIVVLGHSFSTMVKMLELSISKQEKCGVNEQREKVKRVLAIPSYVQELELCAEISGLFDNPLLGDEYPYELNQYDYNNSPEQCTCMHCVARMESGALICALPSTFSIHFFHLDAEIDMEYLIPGNCATRVGSNVNVQMGYDAQLEGHVSYFRMCLEERMSRPFQDDQDDCKDGKPQDWAHEFLHRIPAMHRKTWSPPPKGWIKFNFHGIGGSKDRSAGMGGVFHNEDGVLSFFIGSLGNVDQTVASIGAIELGLKVMLEYHEPVKKLIVEGDDLTVIRWFNRVSHPPARAHDSFLRSYLHLTSMPLPCEGAAVPAEISKDPDHENGSSSHDASPTKPPNDGNIENDASPAKQFEREYIAWRVDEEANQVAIGLARLGSMLPDHQNRVKVHSSTQCDCEIQREMRNGRLPDITVGLPVEEPS
ncbi:uncharacterized protein [Oryza sativa Japonica Group]